MTAPMLSISGLRKSYAAAVLRGIDFTLAPGEVHAIVGANGAGKTTMCNVICGLTDSDAGEMSIDGRAYSPGSIRDSEAAGICIVMQELNFVGDLSIAENLFFSSLPHRYGFIDFQHLFEEADDVLTSIGLTGVDPRRKMHTLGVGQQQLIEIARALMRPCRILILDEPTAALTDPQTELLFEKVTQLKTQGTGIIYISHRMHEIRRIADRVTILRDGEAVTISDVAGLTTDDIVKKMAGEIVPSEFQRIDSTDKGTAVRVRGLSTKQLLRNIDLDIRYGEILGIAGLIGSGRTELLRSIFGADDFETGHIYVGDSSNPVVFRSPQDAVGQGIGLIPEDRRHQGLLPGQSITSNATVSSLDQFRGPFGLINRGQEQGAVGKLRESLDIKCIGINQLVDELSGGNQQKVVIARWLLKDCRVLLFDEPTRGIDIQARNLIYGLLRNLASGGKAIVIVSSENRELTTICDRIAVLSNGCLADVFARGEWTAEKIMAASFSAYTNDAA